MILAVAACAMLAGAAPASPDLVGIYLTNQMEIAGALELRSDGRFRYQVEYGAVSESAEGDWKYDGSAVELTSDPMPVPPNFTLVSDEPAPAGELYVAVENTGFSWSPLSVLVMLDGSAGPVRMDAESNGRVDVPGGSRVQSVSVLMPVYEIAGSPVALSADRGHRLLFRVEANDIGKAALRGETLVLDGASLVLRRYGTAIAFRQADP